jgi:hypothetical protein
VGILMACASAWISALLARTAERPGRERLINVADESWTLQEPSTQPGGFGPARKHRADRSKQRVEPC